MPDYSNAKMGQNFDRPLFPKFEDPLEYRKILTYTCLKISAARTPSNLINEVVLVA